MRIVIPVVSKSEFIPLLTILSKHRLVTWSRNKCFRPHRIWRLYLYFEKKNLAHTGAEGFAITVKRLELISQQFHLRSTNIVLEFYCKIAERSCDFAKVLMIINKMTSDICRKCATVLQSIWCFSPFTQQQSTLDIKILPSIKELLRLKCLFIKLCKILD